MIRDPYRLVRCGLVALWPVLTLTAIRAATLPRVSIALPVGNPSASLPSSWVRPSSETLLRVNPFRLDRRFESEPGRTLAIADSSRPAAPIAPRLTGVVWAAVPLAVVEGLPGAEGPVVVREGDRVLGVTVGRVARGGVTLVAGAVTWRLTIDTARAIQ